MENEPATSRQDRSIHPKIYVHGAFTLIEMVITLTIIAVLAAAAIPSYRGLKDEQIAREPVAELARLAKEARLHAITEKHPYQIAFTEKGFSATRYLSPYTQQADLDKFLQQVRLDDEENQAQPVVPDAAQTTSRQGRKEWAENYSLPQDTRYTLQFWHEPAATPVNGGMVKLWVFQPSGISPPLTVRVQREKSSFEVSFNALTADIAVEKSEVR